MRQLKKYQDIAVYQLLSLSDMYLKIDGEETLVLQSPTGSGKTFMITNYIYEMSKKEEYDLDKEIERLSRKTNININKSEYSFNKRIKELDNEMKKIMDDKVKLFDENKVMTEKYLTIENDTSTIDRYREKLKKI